MDILQRTDLGEEISGAAADQLISLVSSGFCPSLLSHPTFLQHLASEAAQLTQDASSQLAEDRTSRPASSRLPLAALHLLTELAVKSSETRTILVQDLLKCAHCPEFDEMYAPN